MAEQWVEDEGKISLTSGEVPDGVRDFPKYFVASIKLAGESFWRTVKESKVAYHTRMATEQEVFSGKSSNEVATEQLERQGARAEVAKLEDALRAEGFTPVDTHLFWSQKWTRRKAQ